MILPNTDHTGSAGSLERNYGSVLIMHLVVHFEKASTGPMGESDSSKEREITAPHWQGILSHYHERGPYHNSVLAVLPC